MNFEPDEDQHALLDAVARIALRHRDRPVDPAGRFDHAQDLERELDDGGFFDTLTTEGLGPTAALAMLIELSRLPCTAEFTASTLVRPQLGLALPRPCAVLVDGRQRPARFLDSARSVVAIDPDGVGVAMLGDRDAQRVESPFAYPLGRLVEPAALRWQRVDIDVASLRALWSLGIAAEIVGSLAAGLDAVLQHVRDRRQFGRPLGAFQAVQHRLAQCATRVEAGRWLVLEAAFNGTPAGAALAASWAQSMVPGVTYDLHQFMGAMGLTLEHPLHRYTYRAKRLQAEAGGAVAHQRELVARTWAPVATAA